LKRATKRGSRVKVHTASFTLANHPFYLFTQIFLARGRELNHSLAPFDLDYQRWRVLAVLNEFPDCTMQFLADTAGVDRTTLTHTVQLMIKEHLVTKTQRETDRRSVVLSLTSRGRRTLRTILPTIVATNERCFAGFSAAEMNHFMDQLRRIFSNLREGNLPVLVDKRPQKSLELSQRLLPSFRILERRE
jgi:DNA-binding MarR family transcriptional regulator